MRLTDTETCKRASALKSILIPTMKRGIVALSWGYTITYDKMYELHMRISEKQHTVSALCCQHLLLAVYKVNVNNMIVLITIIVW